ncbi:conserved hypothetical protein [Thermus scotoductus SA-01]|uniref:Uncharacterized protein n=1 Tax=Thermus scotoductus (strain ATCC 700910 / SA-01) TaxID=743525 RepID=E8PMA2_THESS|nr:conserved hypothetical protein [Thermus scotoductus SA-01]
MPGLSAPSLPGPMPVLTEGWPWGYSPTGRHCATPVAVLPGPGSFWGMVSLGGQDAGRRGIL